MLAQLLDEQPRRLPLLVDQPHPVRERQRLAPCIKQFVEGEVAEGVHVLPRAPRHVVSNSDGDDGNVPGMRKYEAVQARRDDLPALLQLPEETQVVVVDELLVTKWAVLLERGAPPF